MKNTQNRRRTKPNTKKVNTRCKEESKETESMNKDKGLVTNDPSWYMQYPILLDSSGTYKFNLPVGMPINLGGKYPSLSVPGIMVLATHVAPGIATDVDSPINVQARRLYTYMRATRSGSALYDPADVMTYLLAIDSAYCFYFAMKRMVGCVNRADAANRYVPEDLVAALGFDYSNIQKNVADLTSYLQTYAARLSSFYVPADMTFLARHSTIFSNIYMDKASYKSQFYVYDPSGFYKFVETATPNEPAELQYTRWTGVTGRTVDDIYTMGESLIRPLVASGDVNQISTDIFNAFSNRGFYTVADIPMYYMVMPVYDVEMLNQIQNATLTGEVDTDKITQDVDRGILTFNPRVYGASTAEAAAPYLHDILLSVQYDYTDAPHVMTSTRLSLNVYFNSSDSKMYIRSCGSEWIEYAYVYQHIWENGEVTLDRLQIDRNVNVINMTSSAIEYSDFTQFMPNWAVFSTFDFHPILYAWTLNDGAGSKPIFSAASFNYDYITVLDDNEIQKLHYAALLSEFFVPQP